MISFNENLPPGIGGQGVIAPLSIKFTSASFSAFKSASSGLGKPFSTSFASKKEKATL